MIVISALRMQRTRSARHRGPAVSRTGLLMAAILLCVTARPVTVSATAPGAAGTPPADPPRQAGQSDRNAGSGTDGPLPPCRPVTVEITGDSLQGVVFSGERLTVSSIGCGAPALDDLVVFRTTDGRFVVKQVWGRPGDTLRVADDGRIYVDGRLAETPFGRPYIVRRAAYRLMKGHEGRLDGYLALGHPGSVDSAMLGPIARADIVGFAPPPRRDGTARTP